jgi:hypothetical protein
MVQFSDEGPGLPIELVPYAIDRFRRGLTAASARAVLRGLRLGAAADRHGAGHHHPRCRGRGQRQTVEAADGTGPGQRRGAASGDHTLHSPSPDKNHLNPWVVRGRARRSVGGRSGEVHAC